MITHQPVHNHDDLLNVVDRLLEETGLDRTELGGKMTFAGMDPIRQTGQTAFGEFTRLGSQIEMSRTPEYWADPIIHPIGSSKPEWLPR